MSKNKEMLFYFDKKEVEKKDKKLEKKKKKEAKKSKKAYEKYLKEQENAPKMEDIISAKKPLK